MNAKSAEEHWQLEGYELSERLFLKFTGMDGFALGDVGFYVFTGHKLNRPAGQRMPIHRHTHYELLWVIEGSVVFFNDFRHYKLKAGALAFVSPGRVHTWFGDWAKTRYVVVGIKPDLFAQVIKAGQPGVKLPFADPTVVPFVQTSSPHHEAIDQLFHLLVSRCRTLSSEHSSLLVAYLGIVLAEARLAWSDTAATRQPAKAKVALTDSFRLELEQHHLERLQVQEYAFLLGVSSSYLIEVVRETTGMSPKQLIDDRLALEAKRLLAHTTETVAEIALSLSFNSPSQFSRWFKAVEGISPGQFRRDHVFPGF